MELGPQHSRFAVWALIGCCDYWNQAVCILDIVADVVRALLHDCAAVAIHCGFHLKETFIGRWVLTPNVDVYNVQIGLRLQEYPCTLSTVNTLVSLLRCLNNCCIQTICAYTYQLSSRSECRAWMTFAVMTVALDCQPAEA